MNKLWTFGDSWVHGTKKIARNETFTYHIANSLKLENYNFGKNGASNSSIKDIFDTAKYNFSKNDLILIVWTTPHRDESFEMYNKYFKFKSIIPLFKFPTLIQEVVDYLDKEKFNYKMTQCFNPIFGYDYKLMKKVDGFNFIEWGKPNNTLIDIISYNWLKENQDNIFMNDKIEFSMGIEDNFVQNCKHPSPKGHKLIAKTLLPYLE